MGSMKRLNWDQIHGVPARLSILALAGVLGALILITMIPVGWANAAEQGKGSASDLTELSLEELMEIEISAPSKKPVSISEAPASVVLITRSDIRRYGYRNLAEALQRVIGLYVTNDRTYQYLGVRGFARPGDFNTRVLMLVDGHRINDPIYDYAPIGEDFPIDIESIERIEVARGPGSALWGSNALLAVVNIITRKGSDIEGVRVAGEYGSHSRAKAFLELGRKFDSGLEIAGSITTLDSKGQKHIYYPEFDDPSTNNGTAEGLDGMEVLRGYLTASYEGVRFFFTKGRRDKDIPTGSYDTVFNQSGTKVFGEYTFVELGYERSLFEQVNGEIFLRIYHDWMEYKGDYLYDYGYGVPPLPINKDRADSKLWGTEIRYSMDPLSRLNLTAGFEYQDAYELIMKNYDSDPWFWEYHDSKESYNLESWYLQADADLLDNLRAVVGFRLDDYSTYGDHLSPRAALIYALSKSNALKLLYGEAFRAPNNFERNYEAEGWNLSNPDLDPETIESWELVCEQKISKHTRLVASLFRFDLEDIITKVVAAGGMFQFQNRGTVRSEGIEVQLESRFESDIAGYLGFIAMNAEDLDTGERVPNSPELITNGGISIPLWEKRLYVSPEVSYIGERKTLSGDEVDSSFNVNLSFTTASFLEPFTVSFNVYNLFDKDKAVPGGVMHKQDGIPQEGRTFRFQLSYKF
jgi:iron complex outermembrane receptor protein